MYFELNIGLLKSRVTFRDNAEKQNTQKSQTEQQRQQPCVTEQPLNSAPSGQSGVNPLSSGAFI
jgi:hypothetical protein